MSEATADDIRAEIAAARKRTLTTRVAYENAIRYEQRMMDTLDLMERSS